MIITKFNIFLKEKISVINTDSPSVASSANKINDIENHIKEFNQKKVDLENIYMTATDEKNLVANLSARKFINPVSSKSQMQFFNPILSKYARVCDLKKQISDLEKEQGTVDNSIKDKQSQIGSNPTAKDSLTKDIQTKKTDVENIKRKIGEIKSECDRLERLTMAELQEMQKEIQSGTKEVNQARSQN
jgi:predicted  nucleic acid-binding Zn-ribbon protein